MLLQLPDELLSAVLEFSVMIPFAAERRKWTSNQINPLSYRALLLLRVCTRFHRLLEPILCRNIFLGPIDSRDKEFGPVAKFYYRACQDARLRSLCKTLQIDFHEGGHRVDPEDPESTYVDWHRAPNSKRRWFRSGRGEKIGWNDFCEKILKTFVGLKRVLINHHVVKNRPIAHAPALRALSKLQRLELVDYHIHKLDHGESLWICPSSFYLNLSPPNLKELAIHGLHNYEKQPVERLPYLLEGAANFTSLVVEGWHINSPETLAAIIAWPEGLEHLTISHEFESCDGREHDDYEWSIGSPSQFEALLAHHVHSLKSLHLIGRLFFTDDKVVDISRCTLLESLKVPDWLLVGPPEMVAKRTLGPKLEEITIDYYYRCQYSVDWGFPQLHWLEDFSEVATKLNSRLQKIKLLPDPKVGREFGADELRECAAKLQLQGVELTWPALSCSLEEDKRSRYYN